MSNGVQKLNSWSSLKNAAPAFMSPSIIPNSSFIPRTASACSSANFAPDANTESNLTAAAATATEPSSCLILSNIPKSPPSCASSFSASEPNFWYSAASFWTSCDSGAKPRSVSSRAAFFSCFCKSRNSFEDEPNSLKEAAVCFAERSRFL